MSGLETWRTGPHGLHPYLIPLQGTTQSRQLLLEDPKLSCSRTAGRESHAFTKRAAGPFLLLGPYRPLILARLLLSSFQPRWFLGAVYMSFLFELASHYHVPQPMLLDQLPP